jgi:glycosyl-4,4'-diaponeurosporenoate acyltransferase
VLIELSIGWIIFLNVAGWLMIQLGAAWIFTRLPASCFHPPAVATWEQRGRFYERVFGIKLWKDKLPDAARWFAGGFAKGSLADAEPAYVQRFISETWRGESCHWCAMACAPVFFLWNPWWGNLVIVAYALAANIPCILVQRYNRARLSHLLAAAARTRSGTRRSGRR